jgi:hypothetical protein
MEYSILCTNCQIEGYESNFVKFKIIPNKENKYEYKCSRGHTINIKFQIQTFQLLFLNSIHALKNEYYYESFVSLVGCYERFLEFFIKIIWKSNGLTDDEIKSVWKNMSNQSERQLGSFISCYSLEFKTNPPILNSKVVSLRNNVIHKGIFPDKKDCIIYGDEVLNIIRPTLRILKNEKYALNTGFSMWENNHNDIKNSYILWEPFPVNRKEDKSDLKMMKDYLD